MVGARHGTRFYPDIGGSARSHNFYPSPPMRAEDGIAAVALGLGRTVEQGRRALRFCPKYPRHPVHFSTPEEILANAQADFFALDLSEPAPRADKDAVPELLNLPISAADEDTLARLASTYSPENDAVYDGVGRSGVPVVSFAPILKQRIFPLPEILELLLELSEQGLNVPAEIEFAVNLSTPAGAVREFAFLQMRPVLVSRELERVELEQLPRPALLCFSRNVLGNGRRDDIRDVLLVDRERVERGRGEEVALEVARFNRLLMDDHRPFVLIGVGRWGAADPWLGIPVTWEAIAGAQAIVECTFRDLDVVPSQGSHFFQNLTSSRTGYFTVEAEKGDFVDWDWLLAQPAQARTDCVRHLRFEQPLVVAMDGRKGSGIIAKPG
jgi:hypothetical protein